MRYLKYLRYIIRHKWFVGIECFKRGLFYRGIVHDLSKFLPSEFFPYANYFYGNNGRQNEFDFAWLMHQKRNKHHWQWWILREDDGETKIFEMPRKYAVEMLCDWIGAGRAMGKKSPKHDPYMETRGWYLKNANKIILHPKTKAFIEDILGIH